MLHSGQIVAVAVEIAQHRQRLFAGGGTAAGKTRRGAEIAVLSRYRGFGEGDRARLQPFPGNHQTVPPGIGAERLDLIYDLQDIRQRPVTAQPAEAFERDCRVDILHQIADHPGEIEAFVGDDLESQRGDVVVIFRKVEILEHHVGQIAVSGTKGFTLCRKDQRIAGLIAVPGMDAQRTADLEVAFRAAQQSAVGPDAAEGQDRAAGECHGKAGRIAVSGDGGSALAAAQRFAVLGEFRRPDHLAGNAHPAEMTGEGLAVAGSGHFQFLEPCTLPVGRSEDRGIELTAYERTDRTADRAAQRRAYRAENERCHVLSFRKGSRSGHASAR